MTIDTKKRRCECCQIVLLRKRYKGRLESSTAYKQRKYCSLACANSKTESARKKRQEEAQKREMQKPVEPPNETPLDYMLRIMRDPNEDPYRRDKMAANAARYCHRKASAMDGKKTQQQEAAKQAGSNRFAAGHAPKVIPFGRITKT
ncbi:MAG: hypothetical protein KJ630_24690 [Proteobacteria bacterium]|nr:hypothetical protein [Pseudomonadota bacterium]